MHWLILGSGIAATLWTDRLLKVEQAATNIKITAQEIESIANQQVKDGQINRLTELMNANALLNRHIDSAGLALKRLKRTGQK